jgi:hypothetical protein
VRSDEGLYREWVPGDLLDVILVVLAAAFAVDGYRQGFVVGALTAGEVLPGARAAATRTSAVPTQPWHCAVR